MASNRMMSFSTTEEIRFIGVLFLQSVAHGESGLVMSGRIQTRVYQCDYRRGSFNWQA